MAEPSLKSKRLGEAYFGFDSNVEFEISDHVKIERNTAQTQKPFQAQWAFALYEL